MLSQNDHNLCLTGVWNGPCSLNPARFCWMTKVCSFSWWAAVKNVRASWFWKLNVYCAAWLCLCSLWFPPSLPGGWSFHGGADVVPQALHSTLGELPPENIKLNIKEQFLIMVVIYPQRYTKWVYFSSASGTYNNKLWKYNRVKSCLRRGKRI